MIEPQSDHDIYLSRRISGSHLTIKVINDLGHQNAMGQSDKGDKKLESMPPRKSEQLFQTSRKTTWARETQWA